MSQALRFGDMAALAASLRTERDELAKILERYTFAYPAFRFKPEGAPGSQVRTEQERLMALEDLARAAIAKATPSTEQRLPQS